MELRTLDRHRKYVNIPEREAYRKASRLYEPKDELFYMFLFWTGARISECLNILVADIELDTRQVAVECLKKGRKGVYRYIPLPEEYILELETHFSISERQKDIHEREQLLWTWSRMTATRRMNRIMDEAAIIGNHANARGLRHSFGIWCAISGVPTRVIQKLMGHADVSTTEIYTDFVGKEKRDMMTRYQ